MKLSRLLCIITFITLFSLLYVWQQTEAFRLAYVGQRNLMIFQDLLDKNTVLRYNIQSNGSLIRVGNKVYNCADFQIPDTYRLVRVRSTEKILTESGGLANRENIIARLFGIKRQAEAKTISP
jgi:hypothetical protein